MAYTSIDLLALARDANYFSTLPQTNISEPTISLLSYSPEFERLLGAEARPRKIVDLDWEAFHEAGIYNKKDNSLYVTSNYQSLDDNINITIVSLDDYTVRSTQFPDVWEANGGSAYYPTGSNYTSTPSQQIYCDEGDFEHYSQLVAVDPNTNTSDVILTNFLGRNFSSINDVRQHPVTGDLWFTDASYGWIQHFRPDPVTPNQVYRFEPKTGVIQIVADGFVQPNGLEFSPDLRTLYVSDTGSAGFTENGTLPATIYAYDVSDDSKRVSNRRVFSFVDVGFPDGVHCDTQGNVWAAAGDGVHVWNPEGILLGKIFIGELSNNFAFAPEKVFVFSNSRLWVVEGIEAQGREVCRDFGLGCRVNY
jgi:gluconolactonase